jgi:predicted AlkP superfamily phosphohydrolase/phosphomutase
MDGRQVPAGRRIGRGAAALVFALTIPAGCQHAPSCYEKKVIVIGVDGMDPGFLERHWSALPNLRRLRDSGGFRRLKTTMPPQSPVAWSSFVTGLDPDGHGIYDFVHRDPETLAPYSSTDRTEAPRFQLPLGPWLLPLSKPRVVALRRGTPFWKHLRDAGVPVTIIRMPANYPPADADRALAGMGVPDLAGTFGTFTLYTDDPEEITRNVPGGRIVKINIENGRAMLPLIGPPNSLRRDQRPSSIQMIADVDAVARAARIEAGDSTVILRQGEWSEWIPMDFPLFPHVVNVPGMIRLYAKSVDARFQLYATPANIDPRAPALPISVPKGFTANIAREEGPFFTQGIAEDTSALRQSVFTLPEYLAQSRLVFEDELRLLRYSLRHFGGGLLFFYFSVVDQNSHILWGRHEDELLATYRSVDQAVGEAMGTVPSADFIVMSDHGFTEFNRSFHLNAWLVANGFLVPNGSRTGSLSDVDWSRTQAYGLGLNGLYVNLRGRERNGIVARQDRADLLKRISTALLAVRDPLNQSQVVSTIKPMPESAIAPDLIVGYSPGYRASWDTALGATAGPMLQDNKDPWVGDHCVDPAAVPGVLLSNRALGSDEPELRQLGPAILTLFGHNLSTVFRH